MPSGNEDPGASFLSHLFHSRKINFFSFIAGDENQKIFNFAPKSIALNYYYFFFSFFLNTKINK